MSTLEDAIDVRRSSREIVSAQDIDRALNSMAERVTATLVNEDPLIMAVMQGGAFTAVELCRRLDFPFEFDFVHVTRYGNSLSGGDLSWRALPASDVENRTVLLVDDILDQGVTLSALYRELQRSGAASVYSAVLVSKRLERRDSDVNVDFVGVEIDDVYVFGCGMDYKGYWRGLTSLYAVTTQ